MEKMIKDKFDIESGFIRFKYIANFIIYQNHGMGYLFILDTLTFYLPLSGQIHFFHIQKILITRQFSPHS